MQISLPFSDKILTLPPEIHPYLFDIKRIIEKFIGFDNISSIVLFGSYARGEYTANSDVDVLIILKDEFYSKKSIFFFNKLEKLFLASEQKNSLKFKRNNILSGLLIAVEKSTGMFVSHFICKESAWKTQKFSKVFNVNPIMALLLAPGDIVLKNMRNSYIPLYKDLPEGKFREQIGVGQILKSMAMNTILAACAVLIFPLWHDSIKYSMESFKWSIRNSYLYLFDKPASINNIIDFFSKTAVNRKVFDDFLGLRKMFYRNLGFAIKNIWYVLKIHLTAILYRRWIIKKRKTT